MISDDDLLIQIKALESSVKMVNALKEQNQELIAALEKILNARGWIGRDYKMFALLVLRKIREETKS